MAVNMNLEESSYYRSIIAEGMAKGIAEGRAEEARKTLLRQGRKRFGEPSQQVAAVLTAVADLNHLEELLDRVLDASSWDELLAAP